MKDPAVRRARAGRFLDVAFRKAFQLGPCLRLSSRIKRTVRLKAEAREVAKASPACFNGTMRMRFSMIFTIRVAMATFTGVFVSFWA